MRVRPGTLKLRQENISCMLFDVALHSVFLDLSPQARETNAKIKKWDDIKLKSDCLATKREDNLPNWRRYLQIIYDSRVNIPNTQRTHFTQLNNFLKKTIEKCAEEMNKHFPKKTCRWPTGI